MSNICTTKTKALSKLPLFRHIYLMMEKDDRVLLMNTIGVSKNTFLRKLNMVKGFNLDESLFVQNFLKDNYNLKVDLEDLFEEADLSLKFYSNGTEN